MSAGTSVVVVGAGVVGLACALLLARDGCRVTVVARDLPGDAGSGWASPYAGANVIPPTEMGNRELVPASLRHWQEICQNDQITGVKTSKVCEYYTDKEDDAFIWYKDLFKAYHRLPASELPPGCKLGVSFETYLINPEVFLPWLQSELETMGVKFVRTEVASLAEAAALGGSPTAVVNASGLGAKSLASDDTVEGYRGQTMFVKSDYDQVKMIQGSEYTYVIPRMHSGGVILGGVSQEGVVDTTVNKSTREDILRRVNRMTNNAFAHIDLERDVEMDLVGIRPGRLGGIRVEREGPVVHAYGFKGAGYVFAFGAAEKVKQLIRDISGRRLSRL